MRRLITYVLPVLIFSGFASERRGDYPEYLNQKDTSRIILSGTIRDHQSKEPFDYATVLVYTTDTANVWHGHSRAVLTDGTGKFKIDITSLRDSIKTLVIRAKYINCAFTHVFIQGKVKKSLQFDVDLLYGSGDYKAYYKVNPKTSSLIFLKEIVSVNTPGY